MLIRRSPKFGGHHKDRTNLRWFLYGMLFGGVVIFALLQWSRPKVPVQLVINTPPPTEAQKPEEFLWSDGANIGVSTPRADISAQSPLLVKGTARVFENVLQVRLKSIKKDKKGQIIEEVLAQTAVEVKAPDVGQYGPFEISLKFSPPTTGDASGGVLEVFSASAKDGSEINKLIIPLTF